MNGQKLRIALDFHSDDTGRVNCTEPVKFDASTFSIEKDKGRLARDVTIGSEEISLQFWRGEFEKSMTATVLPDGSSFFFNTMCFEFLLNYWLTYGGEAKVSFIVSNRGVDFIVGLIDFQTAKTDERNYFECKIIQETERAEIKRQEDTKIDVYSNEDLKGNPITPLAPVKILMKALPIEQASSFKSSTQHGFASSTVYGNGLFPITNVGTNNAYVPEANNSIEDTLGYMSVDYGLSPTLAGLLVPADGLNFTFIRARNELSNVSIEFMGVVGSAFQTAVDSPFQSVASGNGKARLLVVIGVDINNPRLVIEVWSHTFSYPLGDTDVVLPATFDTVNIPLILRGETVYIYFETRALATFDGDETGTAVYTVAVNQVSTKINIKATSTAISSVVKAVPYVGLLEQSAKSINGSVLVAPRFKGDGEFASLCAVNGFGMRGRSDRPFYVTWKDRVENLALMNGDAQITKNGVFVGIYRDYYPDREIARFAQVPDRDFTTELNQKHLIKTLDFKFTNFANNEISQNTLNSIHTEAQFKLPNELSDNKREVKIDDILDPILQEELRKMGTQTSEQSKSNDADDKIVVLDTIMIAPGARLQFANFLRMRVNDDGNLEILNRSLSTDSDSTGFTWDTLGTGVGTTVYLGGDHNQGTYTIVTITPTVITLSGSPSFSGEDIITFNYEIVSVNLANRTSNGFEQPFIGIPKGFGNVRYSIKHSILNYYAEELSAMAVNYPDGKIKNTFFKNNGNVTTTEIGGVPVTENADIEVSSLTPAIISPYILDSRVAVDYNAALELFNNLEKIYPDGTIGGYIVCVDSRGNERKVYLTKSSYLWAEGSMNIEGEVKRDSGYLLIEDGGYLRLEDGGRIKL